MREADLPLPHLLIADVGTTIRHGPDLATVATLETEIAAAWPGATAIRERLAGLEGLVEQSVRSPYRVAYTPARYRRLANAALSPAEIDDAVREQAAAGVPDAITAGGTRAAADADIRTADLEAALEAARARLADLPVDIVGSAGIYLDVLPRGVNKGTTLRRVLRWLGRPDHQVLVAGDSMNDFALFQTGLAGVAVGNAEPELIARVRGLPNVHLAAGHGAAGIAEALERFGWLQLEVLDDAQ